MAHGLSWGPYGPAAQQVAALCCFQRVDKARTIQVSVSAKEKVRLTTYGVSLRCLTFEFAASCAGLTTSIDGMSVCKRSYSKQKRFKHKCWLLLVCTLQGYAGEFLKLFGRQKRAHYNSLFLSK